jgi:hypothetical protein
VTLCSNFIGTNNLLLLSQSDGQYAPNKYPHLLQDIEAMITTILGPRIFQQVPQDIRAKLRSAKETLGPEPPRKTPRFLRVVLSPDDSQEHRLSAEWEGNVATMRWDVVTSIIPEADAAMAQFVSVHGGTFNLLPFDVILLMRMVINSF